MSKSKPDRPIPPSEGHIPVIDASGTSYEAGVILGYAWKEALHRVAANWPAGATPWWKDRRFAKLIGRVAPHLPDLYRGMAKGASIPEERCAEPSPGGPPSLLPPAEGCTSFAIQPAATLEGIPITGQTKDTGRQQQFRFQVLRLRLSDAPSALTVTYPGLLFGHGFVAGGCSIFRNALYAGTSEGQLEYQVWGLLALHCRTVDDVVEMTRRHGVMTSGHCMVADERGAAAGIEFGRGGMAILQPKRGLYVHANAVRSGKRLRQYESCAPGEHKAFIESSVKREKRLRERLEPDLGRLTPQLAFMGLCDHDNYPTSICRHDGLRATTTAAIVVEPTRRRLTCTRGAPCCHWPATHCL